MNGKSCKNCRFRVNNFGPLVDGKVFVEGEPEPLTEEEFEEGADEASSECRRYPPRHQGHANDYFFPLVWLNEWCGEWQPVDESDGFDRGLNRRFEKL